MGWQIAGREVHGVAITLLRVSFNGRLSQHPEFNRRVFHLNDTGFAEVWGYECRGRGHRVEISQRLSCSSHPNEVALWVFGHNLERDCQAAIELAKDWGFSPETTGQPAREIAVALHHGLLDHLHSLPVWLSRVS